MHHICLFLLVTIISASVLADSTTTTATTTTTGVAKDSGASSPGSKGKGKGDERSNSIVETRHQDGGTGKFTKTGIHGMTEEDLKANNIKINKGRRSKGAAKGDAKSGGTQRKI